MIVDGNVAIAMSNMCMMNILKAKVKRQEIQLDTKIIFGNNTCHRDTVLCLNSNIHNMSLAQHTNGI